MARIRKVTATRSEPYAAALADAQAALGGRPDVLRVRLGWLFRDGWITDRRALVATVAQKLTPAELAAAGREPLPDEFAGLPVEVTGPTPADLVRLARGPDAAEVVFGGRAVGAVTTRYTPPAGVKLRRVTARMRVVAHVSPDAGWRELAHFLGQTREQLVVGMYDCGAPHIVGALEALAGQAGFEKLTLAMQKGASVGSGTKADDLNDDATVEALEAALGARFEQAWVPIGAANGWVASSYHIKVAVRDGQALWLSSGNWQSSNQPAADPLGQDPPDRKWLDRYNREWHAIVEHAGLARTLAAFLRNDFEKNAGEVRWPPGEEEELPDLLLAEELLAPAAEAPQWRYFPPVDETRRFTVRPLLTPDNYHEHVLRLVRSAREELLIQNQTFNAPREDHAALRQLVDAVIARQRAGVRVRIIFRVLLPSVARETLEALKDYGLNLADVKLQPRCHTKGIVADRRRVLLGSQNWSNDGVSVNRDASLLFEDAPLAQYFGKIFDHDWDCLAAPKIGSEWLPVRAAEAGDAAQPGMLRLPIQAYDEEG
jgi:hypothetical protein